MAFKDVMGLRKNGKYAEAYEMADAEYQQDPENIWAKRALAWCLFDGLKANASYAQKELFLNKITEISELNVSADEDLFWKSVSWPIVMFVRNTSLTEGASLDVISNLFDMIKEWPFIKPSEEYSALFSGFMTLKEKWDRFIEFCDWWNFDNFIERDYQCFTLPNGRKMPLSPAESAYIAYAKALIAFKNPVAISAFIPRMQKLSEEHPEMLYPNFYIGKMLLASGGDGQDAVSALLPFVKKKQTEFWAWQLLAEAIDGDDEKCMACLLRAVNCHTQDQFVVNLYLMLAKALLQLKYYADARFYLDKYLKIKTETQTKISYDAQLMSNEKWYKDAAGKSPEYKLDYMSITNEILYGDIAETIAVVSFVNADKKMATVVYGEKHSGFFKYDSLIKRINAGDILKIRISEVSSDGHMKVFSAKTVNENISTNFYKVVDGTVSSSKTGTAFFLNVGKESYYIPSNLVEKNQLKVNDVAKANVLYSFDRKRDQWSWACVTICKK